MTYCNFPASLEAVLKHEGGYVNHPRDPGGRTNLGVTQRVYEEWVGYPVSEQIMRNLTVDHVKALYKAKYWDAVRGDKLPMGIDYIVFDFAVNSGVNRASRYLQWLVGVDKDGIIGPRTLSALKQHMIAMGPHPLITTYQERRMTFLRGLSHWDTFGKGWTRRVNEVEVTAKQMAGVG